MAQASIEERIVILRSGLKKMAQITLDDIGADQDPNLVIFYAPPQDLVEGCVDRTIIIVVEDATVDSLTHQFEHFSVHQRGRVPFGYVALIEDGAGLLTKVNLMDSSLFSDGVRSRLEAYIQSQYAIMTGSIS
jgi:hypothetical protein